MAGFFFLGGPLTTTKLAPPPPQEAAEAITGGGFELSWTNTRQQYYNSKRQQQQHDPQEGGAEIGCFQGLEFDELQPGLGLTAAAVPMRGAGLGGGVNCQDCGNQAKKDCAHMRCRTCCKSRGFPCETHVKSTWVPAARRRERQQLATMQMTEREQDQEENRFRMENPKRSRDHHQNNNSDQIVVPAASHQLALTTTSGFDVTDFPVELNSSALFRCVRVSNVDESEEEYAYQTAVNIGGRIFKGILYDQGLDNTYPATGDGSSGTGGDGAQPQRNFIAQATPAAAAAAAAATTNNMNATALLDPSLVYPTHLNAFMAGTQLFPPPKS
ncbi:hypothetical protein SAY86_004167 [Trapa natans]|uniref:Protein SHI RELATED SEQUENCE 1 n=1 Tax=Trapa natans TaxID=22666 RepID=A0AAN7RIL5_TRANT|nr:hypothetical protein SAY86_004167 [Trapa natans]